MILANENGVVINSAMANYFLTRLEDCKDLEKVFILEYLLKHKSKNNNARYVITKIALYFDFLIFIIYESLFWKKWSKVQWFFSDTLLSMLAFIYYHRFVRVKFWIFVLIFFNCTCQRKTTTNIRKIEQFLNRKRIYGRYLVVGKI